MEESKHQLVGRELDDAAYLMDVACDALDWVVSEHGGMFSDRDRKRIHQIVENAEVVASRLRVMKSRIKGKED